MRRTPSPWNHAVIRFCAFLAIQAIAFAADTTVNVVCPNADNSFNGTITLQGKTVLRYGIVGWGDGWKWAGSPKSTDKAPSEKDPLKCTTAYKISGQPVNLTFEGKLVSDRAVDYTYTLTSEKDLPLTLIAMGIDPVDKTSKLSITITDKGTDTSFDYPFPKRLSANEASKAVLHTETGDVTLQFDPPMKIHADGGLRLSLIEESLKAGTTTQKIAFSFPAPIDFAASEAGVNKYVEEVGKTWFPFTPTEFHSPGVIGMQDWLDKPAGKHGILKMVGDHFEFEDGTRIQFWGTNLQYIQCAPSKEKADATVARFAKYGVNAVRLHKFSNPGWEGIGDKLDATQFNPTTLDRMDYFAAELAKSGIYYGISHSFNWRVREANKSQLLAYDEIAKNLKGETYGLVNFAEDVQDLMIQMVVNFLRHPNPYTGKTWAEDPALAWVELQNEDDILFYAVGRAFDKCPTYAKKFTDQFNDWLKARYGSQAGLESAWGNALAKGEVIDDHTVFLNMNPYYLSYQNNVGNSKGRMQVRVGDKNFTPSNQEGALRRAVDTMLFLHDTQNKFYAKFIKAIRDAGYKGPIEGSPWQAAPGLPHYFNLRSDYLAGFIDRHNYGPNRFYETILKTGIGLFSTGLQQVIDRPFSLSEWTNVYPCHYLAEAPAMIAVYGMGLQGWDSSFQFTSVPEPGFYTEVGSPPWNLYKVDLPANMGQYPALARMIYRGDVKESDVISARKVSLHELEEGKLSFDEQVIQYGDVKSFTGDVPAESLLAGRCVVQFTDKPEASTFPDMAKYKKGPLIVSSTGQLTWDTTDPNHCSFTVNTAGTKAIVGFAQNKTAELGQITMTSHSPYISLFLTALKKDETLDNAKSALVSIISRNTSTGLSISTLDTRVVDNGTNKGPVLLEPVQADIEIKSRSIVAVNVLDAEGQRTSQTVPVENGKIHLDTGRDKTMYYEIVFK